MKKLLYLFLLTATLFSCSESVQFNTPAFQGLKNAQSWKANTMTAARQGNGLLIVGSVGTDVVTLQTASANPGTYVLGVNNTNKAIYESLTNSADVFSTGTGIGSGKVVITEGIASGKLTGTFEFVVKNAQGNEVSFTKGNFYKVPVQ